MTQAEIEARDRALEEAAAVLDVLYAAVGRGGDALGAIGYFNGARAIRALKSIQPQRTNYVEIDAEQSDYDPRES